MDFILKHRLKQDELYCSDDNYKDDYIFNIKDLRKEFNIEKCGRGYIVWQNIDNKIDFAVLDFFTAFDDNEHCNCIWHGYGFGDALRELRHSYFTSDYYFYLDLDLMEKSCQFLKKHFD